MMRFFHVFIVALAMAFAAPSLAGSAEQSSKAVALSELELKALADALFERELDVVLKLIDGRSLDGSVFKNGKTPLGMLLSTPILEPGASNSSVTDNTVISTMHRMLQAGADPNAVDSNGMTPLTSLVAFGKDTPVEAQMVGMLVDNGANINGPSSGGQTPLSLAAFLGRSLIADALVRKGADTSLKNAQGKSAAEIARERGYPALAERLATK